MSGYHHRIEALRFAPWAWTHGTMRSCFDPRDHAHPARDPSSKVGQDAALRRHGCPRSTVRHSGTIGDLEQSVILVEAYEGRDRIGSNLPRRGRPNRGGLRDEMVVLKGRAVPACIQILAEASLLSSSQRSHLGGSLACRSGHEILKHGPESRVSQDCSTARRGSRDCRRHIRSGRHPGLPRSPCWMISSERLRWSNSATRLG